MTALIILAVIIVIIAVILSVSATFTITYDHKWKTKIGVLWFEWDIELTKILDFILFPQKSAENVKAKKQKTEQPPNEKPKDDQKKITEAEANTTAPDASQKADDSDGEKKTDSDAESENKPKQKQAKPNFLKNIWDKDGIVGIMTFVSNMLQTASSAVTSLIRGFHIHSFYVKILVGGSDADEIARAYGRICKYYYPFKGTVLSGMKVDNYDDWIAPDFIAPRNEYGFQFIGSISVGALLRVVLAAAKTFLVNIIKNK